MMDVLRPYWLMLVLLGASGLLPTTAAFGLEAVPGGEVPHALLKTYCIRCHDADKHKGDVDLTAFGARPDSLTSRKAWRKVVEQLESEEMPPEDPQPSD